MNDSNKAVLGPIITGISGLTLSDSEVQQLADPLIGGVILFDRNFQDKPQLQRLVSQIRAAAPSILITVDQEGGRVQRLQNGFTTIPAAASLGHGYEADPTTTCKAVHQAAFTMASQLRTCDIDLSFAPVLDCHHGVSSVIGDRSFAADPNAVTALTKAYRQGMRDAGMAAVGKHFPGHGAIKADTHIEFAEDPRSFEAILQHDLKPFQALITVGLEAIMPAHIVFPKVDSQPTCFSKKWLQDILRQQLNFNGVIISDDLGMHAATVIGDMPTRAQAAINAGCDMVIIGNDLDTIPQVLASLSHHHDPQAAARRQQLKPTQLESTV